MADQITQKKSKEKNETSKKQGLGKPVKYLFDNHLFDTPYDEPEEESQEKKDEPPPPPPPTYNEKRRGAKKLFRNQQKAWSKVQKQRLIHWLPRSVTLL